MVSYVGCLRKCTVILFFDQGLVFMSQNLPLTLIKSLPFNAPDEPALEPRLVVSCFAPAPFIAGKLAIAIAITFIIEALDDFSGRQLIPYECIHSILTTTSSCRCLKLIMPTLPQT
jgi:hypothetical protein